MLTNCINVTLPHRMNEATLPSGSTSWEAGSAITGRRRSSGYAGLAWQRQVNLSYIVELAVRHAQESRCRHFGIRGGRGKWKSAVSAYMRGFVYLGW